MAKQVWTATGRRKRSVAQVRMTAGKGNITVNGKDVNEYMVGKRIGHSKMGEGIIAEVGKIPNSVEHFIRIDFGLNGIKDYKLEQLIRAQTISFL